MGMSLEFCAFIDTVDDESLAELFDARAALAAWVESQYDKPATTSRGLAHGLGGIAAAVNTIVDIGGTTDSVNGLVVVGGEITRYPSEPYPTLDIALETGSTRFTALPFRECLADPREDVEMPFQLTPTLRVVRDNMIVTDIELPSDDMIEAFDTGTQPDIDIEDIYVSTRRRGREYLEYPFADDYRRDTVLDSVRHPIATYQRHLSRLARILLWAVPNGGEIVQRRRDVDEAMHRHDLRLGS